MFADVMKPEVLQVDNFSVPITLIAILMIGIGLAGYGGYSFKTKKFDKPVPQILMGLGIVLALTGGILIGNMMNTVNKANNDPNAKLATHVAIELSNEFALYGVNNTPLIEWINNGSEGEFKFVNNPPNLDGTSNPVDAVITVKDGVYVYSDTR